MVVCGRKTPDTLPAAGGRTASCLACDVRDPESVDRLVAACGGAARAPGRAGEQRGGRAVHGGGHGVAARFSEKIIALNLTSALHWLCRSQPRDAGAGGPAATS
ncbi:MAG: hypothetical protein IPG17_26555 [Sandaracinaceae bacterium]|nr:hypothetical protein [Sandaracinaceae bacterium]